MKKIILIIILIITNVSYSQNYKEYSIEYRSCEICSCNKCSGTGILENYKYIPCNNCKDWASSYRNLKGCDVCKNNKGKYGYVKENCWACDGKGKWRNTYNSRESIEIRKKEEEENRILAIRNKEKEKEANRQEAINQKQREENNIWWERTQDSLEVARVAKEKSNYVRNVNKWCIIAENVKVKETKSYLEFESEILKYEILKEFFSSKKLEIMNMENLNYLTYIKGYYNGGGQLIEVKIKGNITKSFSSWQDGEAFKIAESILLDMKNKIKCK